MIAQNWIETPAQDPKLREIFEFVAKYWEPRSRSRESLSEEVNNDGAEGGQAEDGCEAAEDGASRVQGANPSDEAGVKQETQEGEERLGEDGYIDGETTPPTSTRNEDEDELLAWTLGGSLKMTPGSPWASHVLTPAKNEVPDPNSIEWINQRLADLEILSLH